MPNTLISLPAAADLESRSGWHRIGPHTYYAERYVILVVKTRKRAVDGPALCCATYPAGSKYTFSTKRVVARKYSESVQTTAQLALSNKLSMEFLSKQSLGTGTSTSGPSISFGAEASQKIASELMVEVRNALSVATAFEIQNSEEITRSIEVNDGGSSSEGSRFDVSLYLKLYEWHFNYYLIRIDQLTLEYRKRLFGLFEPIRKKVSSSSDPKALPLFRLRLYDPIDGLSVAKGTFQPTVDMDEALSVHVEPLSDSAPPSGPVNVGELVSMAKLAFPKTSEERAASAKGAARRKAAKKALAKKAAAKKAFKMAALKKAAKKTAPKKAAPKKAPAKKAFKMAASKAAKKAAKK